MIIHAFLVLAVLVMIVVGIDQAYATHCNDPYLDFESCDSELFVSIGVVNATLHPAITGNELIIWLSLTPGPSPHDYISINYITIEDGVLLENCLQYPKNEPLEITEQLQLKTCFFIPKHIDINDLGMLHASYIIETRYITNDNVNITSFYTAIPLETLKAKYVFESSLAPNDTDTEPAMCEAPDMVNAQSEGTPRLLGTAYNPKSGDLVIFFNKNVTLVEGWQDSITIGGMSVGERARNHMVGASSMAWISVEFGTKYAIKDADLLSVTIESGTVQDAYGNINDLVTTRASIAGH